MSMATGGALVGGGDGIAAIERHTRNVRILNLQLQTVAALPARVRAGRVRALSIRDRRVAVTDDTGSLIVDFDGNALLRIPEEEDGLDAGFLFQSDGSVVTLRRRERQPVAELRDASTLKVLHTQTLAHPIGSTRMLGVLDARRVLISWRSADHSMGTAVLAIPTLSASQLFARYTWEVSSDRSAIAAQREGTALEDGAVIVDLERRTEIEITREGLPTRADEYFDSPRFLIKATKLLLAAVQGNKKSQIHFGRFDVTTRTYEWMRAPTQLARLRQVFVPRDGFALVGYDDRDGQSLLGLYEVGD